MAGLQRAARNPFYRVAAPPAEHAAGEAPPVDPFAEAREGWTVDYPKAVLKYCAFLAAKNTALEQLFLRAPVLDSLVLALFVPATLEHAAAAPASGPDGSNPAATSAATSAMLTASNPAAPADEAPVVPGSGGGGGGGFFELFGTASTPLALHMAHPNAMPTLLFLRDLVVGQLTRLRYEKACEVV